MWSPPKERKSEPTPKSQRRFFWNQPSFPRSAPETRGKKKKKTKVPETDEDKRSQSKTQRPSERQRTMFVPLPVPFVFQRSASDFSAWRLKSSLAPRSSPGKMALKNKKFHSSTVDRNCIQACMNQRDTQVVYFTFIIHASTFPLIKVWFLFLFFLELRDLSVYFVKFTTVIILMWCDFSFANSALQTPQNL